MNEYIMKPKIILEKNMALDCLNMTRKRFSIPKMVWWKTKFLWLMFLCKFIYRVQEVKNKEANKFFMSFYDFIQNEKNIAEREILSLQNYMTNDIEVPGDEKEETKDE
jgi:hypothetical protein